MNPASPTTNIDTQGTRAGRQASKRRGGWRDLLVSIAGPVAVFYIITGLHGGVLAALLASSALPAVDVLVDLARRRRPGTMGLLILAALAASAALALIAGSSRLLLARDGFLTGAWAVYMYVSLLANRPATYVISRPLLEGRRLLDPVSRQRIKPTASFDELWDRLPGFARLWRRTTVIWGTAILADAAARILMAWTLPVRLVPGLGAALWPVTFVALQVVTNVYFARAGFWRMLATPVQRGDDQDPTS
jgi:hypothetical protein